MIISIYIIFAALLGSFLASFIYRYVNKNIEADSYVESINIYTEPSFCPACKTKIDWYHLIPVLSYLFLRGKAKCCGATISSRYFLIEILVISLFLLVFITNASWDLILFRSFISLTLIFIALIDYQYKIIPLSSLLILFILALILSSLEGLLILPEIFVAIISGFLLLATRWLFFKLKGKEALGLGDVILFPILIKIGKRITSPRPKASFPLSLKNNHLVAKRRNPEIIATNISGKINRPSNDESIKAKINNIKSELKGMILY